MSDLSAAAAAALGVPEAIVLRSAAARAAETGMSVDDVLGAWAGGGSVAAPAPSSEAGPAPEPAEETPVADTEPESAPVPPAPTGTTPSEPGVAAAVARAPVPAEVTPAQAASLPEVVTVPTAGIRERMNLAVPRWLAAVMLIIPAFALIALGGSATGECGAATELQTDVVTGEIVNCDGTEFTGSGVGGGGTDFLAQGEAIYAAAPGACAGCHGAQGGGGVGPGFGGVLTTFGSCEDHIEWVALGTPGFQAEGRSTYGDSNKPVGGGGTMPPFGNTLTEEQLASVVAFERVRFGGANADEALADCGLAEPAGGDGAEGEGGGGEEPAGDGTVTPTTLGGAEADAGAAG